MSVIPLPVQPSRRQGEPTNDAREIIRLYGQTMRAAGVLGVAYSVEARVAEQCIDALVAGLQGHIEVQDDRLLRAHQTEITLLRQIRALVEHQERMADELIVLRAYRDGYELHDEQPATTAAGRAG